MFDKTYLDFLDAQKHQTRITYSSNLRKWIEFTQLSGTQIIEGRKEDKTFQWEKKVLDFRAR